jgi:hypothetical protein
MGVLKSGTAYPSRNQKVNGALTVHVREVARVDAVVSEWLTITRKLATLVE